MSRNGYLRYITSNDVKPLKHFMVKRIRIKELALGPSRIQKANCKIYLDKLNLNLFHIKLYDF